MGQQLYLILSAMILHALLFKWNKTLNTIVLLEVLTALALAQLMGLSTMNLKTVVLLFPFLVSEALILLAALLSTLRLSGTVFMKITSL